MTTILRTEEEDYRHFMRWFKDDSYAARLAKDLFYMFHLWDDLIDRDRQRSGDEINHAFQIALLDLHENPFYLDNFRDLHPVIRAAVNDWKIANKLEEKAGDDKSGEAFHALHISYTLRCSILSILTHMAYLIGGDAWGVKAGEEIRLYGQEHTLQAYIDGQFPPGFGAKKGNHKLDAQS